MFFIGLYEYVCAFPRIQCVLFMRFLSAGFNCCLKRSLSENFASHARSERSP